MGFGALIALLATAAPAGAVSRTVTSSADTSTLGTLRQVLEETESNSNAPTVDQINFDPSVTTINLTSSLPEIHEPLTITGPGPGSLTIRRDPGVSSVTKFGLVAVNLADAGSTVTISGLTLSGADSTGFAGGALQMFAPGTLAIDSAVIKNNTGGQAAALYYDHGLTTISNSSLTGNSATDVAGGNGGAILGVGGEARIVNSTIDGNSAARFGGGVYTGGDAVVRILSSTITHNTADLDSNGAGDGAIYNSSTGQFEVADTLLAGNVNGDGDGDAQCSGDPFASGGYNLRSASDSGCSGFGAPGDFVNALPMIAAVPALNGGATPNIALLSGSPAIDAGNTAALGDAYPACPTEDQRALFRGGVAGRCDIGSYEFNASSSPPSSGGGTTTPPPSGGSTSSPRAAALAKCKKKFPKGPKRKKCIKKAKKLPA